MELIGRSYNEAQNTNKRITLSFIVRKYVKVTWDGLKYLKNSGDGGKVEVSMSSLIAVWAPVPEN